MDFNEIENKHKELLKTASWYMKTITDYEHNLKHMDDVVAYTKELLEKTSLDVNWDVCIISAYWHDVGRIQTNDGHERVSAEILKNKMVELKYDEQIINDCYKAIENHKWNMFPETLEGMLVKDADKLAWLGKGRWKDCIDNNQRLDKLIELLPNLKNKILNLEESKKIYDRDIIKLIKFLYDETCKNLK